MFLENIKVEDLLYENYKDSIIKFLKKNYDKISSENLNKLVQHLCKKYPENIEEYIYQSLYFGNLFDETKKLLQENVCKFGDYSRFRECYTYIGISYEYMQFIYNRKHFDCMYFYLKNKKNNLSLEELSDIISKFYDLANCSIDEKKPDERNLIAHSAFKLLSNLDKRYDAEKSKIDDQFSCIETLMGVKIPKKEKKKLYSKSKALNIIELTKKKVITLLIRIGDVESLYDTLFYIKDDDSMQEFIKPLEDKLLESNNILYITLYGFNINNRFIKKIFSNENEFLEFIDNQEFRDKMKEKDEPFSLVKVNKCIKKVYDKPKKKKNK